MINFDCSGLSCLILIGSHARGDDDINSDVDLIGISSNENHTMISARKINMSIYSILELKKMMIDGDLFALHVKMEGIPLINKKTYEYISSFFIYKKDYHYHKVISYIMGCEIKNNVDMILNWGLVNKRISWCVRTFILCEMAEERNVSFSKKDMALFAYNRNFLTYHDAMILINAKSYDDKSNIILGALSLFLSRIDYLDPGEEKKSFLIEKESILNSTFSKFEFDSYNVV